ncbi:DUF977 family protein [Escherichia coli]|nr:DUF977 family protein [Escherichia coli]
MLSAEKGYSFQREFTVNGWQVRQEKQGLSANQHKNRKAGAQPYDRHQNIICRECRQSEVMQRVLAFYQEIFRR